MLWWTGNGGTDLWFSRELKTVCQGRQLFFYPYKFDWTYLEISNFVKHPWRSSQWSLCIPSNTCERKKIEVSKFRKQPHTDVMSSYRYWRAYIILRHLSLPAFVCFSVERARSFLDGRVVKYACSVGYVKSLLHSRGSVASNSLLIPYV